MPRSPTAIVDDMDGCLAWIEQELAVENEAKPVTEVTEIVQKAQELRDLCTELLEVMKEQATPSTPPQS